MEKQQQQQQQPQPQPYPAPAAPPPPYGYDASQQPTVMMPPLPPNSQPAQPGYTSTTVVIGQQPVQPVVFVQSSAIRFDKVPVQIQCSNCQNAITTRTEQKTGTLNWLACGGLTLFGCWLGCCLIPFCIDDLKDTYHYCPTCHAMVGVYHRFS